MKVRVFRGVAGSQPVGKPQNLPHCISTAMRRFHDAAKAITTLTFGIRHDLFGFSSGTFSAIIRPTF